MRRGAMFLCLRASASRAVHRPLVRRAATRRRCEDSRAPGAPRTLSPPALGLPSNHRVLSHLGQRTHATRAPQQPSTLAARDSVHIGDGEISSAQWHTAGARGPSACHGRPANGSSEAGPERAGKSSVGRLPSTSVRKSATRRSAAAAVPASRPPPRQLQLRLRVPRRATVR
ncbi:hypothetical protein HYPSUDRAFT_202107 [Hypholoma sublateritium FD-334 SS-4]|uniref:Uncharacterized protein n=1 Tax=Hypholoma sublateritium (strain FD-334 SS-4) TaxID=945553 RepID=A0A0D2PRT3_HYPSF|nr:hypothetical protein HYPSUDRAFT_202107 [Hypholoma sublateritium FD-334 SS-4]